MPNEFVFLAAIILCLGLTIGSYALGRTWMFVYLGILNSVLITIGAFSSEVFGLSAAIASAMYASNFLATDILTERYGRREARKCIYIQVGAFFITPLFGFLALQMTPTDFAVPIKEAMEQLYGVSWRIFAAAIITTLISQSFDIWFFDKINKKTKGKYLWLRNNLSTGTSQLIDSFVFWFIAFYGIIPNIVEVTLVAWLVKLAVAAMDTPFVYISKKIEPLEDRMRA